MKQYIVVLPEKVPFVGQLMDILLNEIVHLRDRQTDAAWIRRGIPAALQYMGGRRTLRKRKEGKTGHDRV